MSTAKRSIIRIILRHVVCITCVWNSYLSTRSASETSTQTGVQLRKWWLEKNGSSHGQSAQQLVKFMDIVIDSCVLGGFLTSTEALQRRTVKPTAKRIYMPPKREGRYLWLVYIMFIFDNENCHWRHVESGRRRDFFLVVRDTQDFFYYWKRELVGSFRLPA